MLIDITRPIHIGMAIYPNNPSVVFAPQDRGIIKVVVGTHTGTHIDAPSHIYPTGVGTFSYSLEQLCGPCKVIDVSHVKSVITATDIPSTTAPRIIFKTSNSLGAPDVFDDNFVALDDSAAAECVRRGIKLVGLDALSIKKRGSKNRVHEMLIDAGICILEGLWLTDVPAGEYELLCLPIKWDLDGAPARAVLKK